ncbi:hypothetical protein D3C73_802210 [compost metagenome]
MIFVPTEELSKVNSPLPLVMVPFFLPCTITLAPTSTLPFSSTTFPLILDWFLRLSSSIVSFN